jgi:hypothetical protein
MGVGWRLFVLNRAFLLMGLVALLLLSAAPLAPGQTPGKPAITVSSQYIVGGYGFGVVNETVSFNNTGSSAVQIPSFSLGFPHSLASRFVGSVAIFGTGFTVSNSTQGGNQTFTAASSQSLQPGATASFSIKGLLKSVVARINGSVTHVFVLHYPSLNMQADVLKSTIQIPSAASLSPVPTGYTAGASAVGAVYKNTFSNLGPTSSLVSTPTVVQGATPSFVPLRVYSAHRTISVNSVGTPQVEDDLTLKNNGTSPINTIRLSLLDNTVNKALVVSKGVPPLLNPTQIDVTGGFVNLQQKPFLQSLAAGANLSLSIVYNL